MNLHQGFVLTQILRPISFLRSIFPKIDRMLEETDCQKALQFVGQKKSMKRYVDMVDFLFVEIFQEFRRSCFQFYRKKGPPLVDVITEEDRVRFEAVLVKALELATIRLQKREFIYWSRFREEVLKAAA